MRINESEKDYQNWLSKYDVDDDVLKEIDQTYTELYNDLFNNSENLSKHKDKWIIFKVDSSNSFKDLFDDLEQINFIGKDFTYTNFKLEKEDDNNPIYSADKTATADIIGRDGKTVMQHNGEIRRAKNLSVNSLKSLLDDNIIKWFKEPELYDYYVKITKDIREITHMSTDKEWDSCMKIKTNNNGIYSNKIIDSIKNGLLVAYVYKTKTGDIKSIDNDSEQFAKKAIARISINPYESKTKFLYLKAMKTYATQEFHNEKPFNLKDEVQDYLDKHFNFGLLDTEDIFYYNDKHYNDLSLYELSGNPFSLIDNNNLKQLQKYINDGKDLDITLNDLNLLDYAISYNNNNKIINLLKKYIPLNVNNTTIKYIINEEIKKLGNNAVLNHLDVSNVTDMRLLFNDSNFNGDISEWDTSKVNNMRNMFNGSYFNGDISEWDVSNVETMESMFYGSKFNQDISKWNVSKVTDMSQIFNKSSFDQDISNWNISKNTNTYGAINNCPLENKPEKWFKGAINDLNILRIIEQEIERLGDNADLNHLYVGNVTNMRKLFYGSNFNGDISKWDVSNVTNMIGMFDSSEFNGDISNWDTSNVISMNFMFSESQFNQDISNWNTSNVLYMNYMFSESQFNQDISNWDVSRVNDMKGMFERSQFNQDISDWNVSRVNDMTSMFIRSKFNQDISKWDIKNVKYMDNMFYNSSFNQNIDNWIIPNGTSTSLMFYTTNPDFIPPIWYK